ncbi:MAG TPA: transporter substrate-binding domain-containing protein [bacterium]|nr:transporter substrate-binding domain-containing protein [bacterium]
MTSAVPPGARSALAPSGTLRAGLNYGNFLLVTGDGPDRLPRGIAPDLARELGRRLGVPVEFVRFPQAGPLADAVREHAWDIAFLGNEPQRAAEIVFTPPYLEIPVTYLVPAGSPIRAPADADRDGVRIAVSGKSAYDLFLSRTLTRATLVRAQGIEASVRLFVEEKLDALACLKPRLVAAAEELPGSRVLGGRVTAVQQSIGTPRRPARAAAVPAAGRDEGETGGAAYLREFVEEAKASGLVARLIDTHGVRGVTVAPAAGQGGAG